MNEYTFAVTVRANTPEQAENVMAAMAEHDEDYGFEYEIEWEGE